MQKLSEIEIVLKPSDLIKLAESWKKEYESYALYLADTSNRSDSNCIATNLGQGVHLVWRPEYDDEGNIINA